MKSWSPLTLTPVLKWLSKLFVLKSPRSSCAPLGARPAALHASLSSVLTTIQCTNGYSISIGCKWLVALSQQSALEVKHPRLYLQGRFL